MKIVNESDQENNGGVVYMIRGPQIDWGTITLQPGDVKGAHYHEKLAETFYVTEGTITFMLTKPEEKDVDIPAGTAIRCEVGKSHGLKNITDKVAKVVFI